MCSNVTKLTKHCLFKICVIAFQSIVENLWFISLFCLKELNFIWKGFDALQDLGQPEASCVWKSRQKNGLDS